jgi:hypothetical protein
MRVNFNEYIAWRVHIDMARHLPRTMKPHILAAKATKDVAIRSIKNGKREERMPPTL